MLRLLTDEQVSPAVSEAARLQRPSMQITCLRDWHGGHLLGATDEILLHEAHRLDLTLASYDLRTLPSVLRRWAEEGIDHGGVVLVDERTIRQSDVGSLGRALGALWDAQREVDWLNRVVFLKAGSG